ncbi:MAG: hypothetical protein OEQ13_10845 [Acidobacteriota bacterium]|nr:hypothetical protein [Acidobacteriota bacterium]
MSKLHLLAPTDIDATPLVDGLDRPPWSDRVDLLRLPDRERIVTMLDDGAADAALLPTGALARRAGALEIVPGIAIGADGPGATARLLHRIPLGDTRTIASAAQGHAAETLVMLLFREAGRDPRLVEWPGSLASALDEHDALLVVGDDALTFDDAPAARSVDLGEAWSELTGLPFLWSVWAARPGVIDRALYGLLHGVRSRGRHRMLPIVASFAERHGLVAETLAERLRSSVTYRLGRRQLDGLRAFWARAARHGLLPQGAIPRFVTLDAGKSCREIADRISRLRRAT